MLKTIVSKFQTVMGSSLSHQSATDTIFLWRTKPAHELIFDSSRRDISQYMQAVDRLIQSPDVKGFNELIAVATARLKLEFHSVLSRQADHHHHQAGLVSTTEWSSVTDSTAYAFRYEEYIYESLSNDVIIYLKNIAQRMNFCGKIEDCVRVYKTVRKSFLQDLLKRLRFDELSIGFGGTRKYVSDELKLKIELWVQVSKICVKILFEKEKILCDQIFGEINDVKDECFVLTVENFATGLFAFAEDITSSNHPYTRIETILSLYDSFVSILPNIDALFLSEPGKRIRIRCLDTLSRIENDVTRMLHDFENDVLCEVSKNRDDRGEIHDLTKYVMLQIDHIVRNKNLLTRLIKSSPSLNFEYKSIPREDLGNYLDNITFLDQNLILIIFVLQMNLESKSKSYENPSLGQLFMMNNIHYIIKKIEESNELQQMIGDSYMRKLNEDVEFAKGSYEALTCSKFLRCLEDEGLYITRCFKSRVSKSVLKKRVKIFNSVFEEIKVSHRVWTVTDARLRDDVRFSLSKKLVPSYKKFLEKFGSDKELKLLKEKSVKYSVEDLEDLVLERLFADSENVV